MWSLKTLNTVFSKISARSCRVTSFVKFCAVLSAIIFAIEGPVVTLLRAAIASIKPRELT